MRFKKIWVIFKLFPRYIKLIIQLDGGRSLKRYIIVVLLLFAVVAASGCINQGATGSGNVINESRSSSGFNQIDLNGAGELIITQGNNESLTIEAENNLMQYIKTGVSNNKLSITFDNKMPVPTKGIKFYITVKDLSDISISGSGKIVSNNLNVNGLNININGAGEGDLSNFNAQTLKIIISGAGKMNIAGAVNEQSINISGAGDYNANSLTSKTASISINGGGRAVVRVSDALNTVINGGGQISYIGNPEITQQINGAGDIRQI